MLSDSDSPPRDREARDRCGPRTLEDLEQVGPGLYPNLVTAEPGRRHSCGGAPSSSHKLITQSPSNLGQQLEPSVVPDRAKYAAAGGVVVHPPPMVHPKEEGEGLNAKVVAKPFVRLLLLFCELCENTGNLKRGSFSS